MFAALPVAVIVIDPDDRIAHANALAEQLLNLSERLMVGQPLDAILPPPGEGSARDGHGFAIYDTEIATARGHKIRVDFVEAQIPDHPGWRAITLHSAGPSRRLGHASDRGAGARAAVGAAAMLAHEIKNPLSGIRGAAQLLNGGELTTLITTEVDRIAALIDRMQDFSDTRPLPLAAENIYPLLAHARGVALAGFARGIEIKAGTVAVDARPGGRYAYTMVNPADGAEYPTAGVYREVDPPKRLVFTWASPGDPDDTAPVITVDLRELPGDRTEMLFHLRGVAGRPGDEDVYDGWDSAFDLLGEQLAAEVR